MIEHSESIKNISAALLEFQAEIHGVVRDSANSHFRNRYASLEAVIETAKPGLQKAKIAFLQAPGSYQNGCFEVATMLIHSPSGEWMRFVTSTPLAKADPQGVGSAITYLCRYSLMAALGLPPVDDDAEATRRPDARPPQAGMSPVKTMIADHGPPVTPLLSEPQCKEIAALMTEANADYEKFMMLMGVEWLAQIPASQFERAKTELNRKIALNKQIEAAKAKKQVSDNGRRHVE